MRLLNEYDVLLEGILLKPNMCLPGLDAPAASPTEVAKYTTRVMMRTIPPSVPGIHFLSGGMSEEESTLNLQALQEACPDAPWSLTFSYGRALQSSTLKTWGGEQGNWDKAQAILVALAKANSGESTELQCCVVVLFFLGAFFGLFLPTWSLVVVFFAPSSFPFSSFYSVLISCSFFPYFAEAQQGKFKGPHPVPGGGRILQALRFGGAGK
jgi:hypothetical protein